MSRPVTLRLVQVLPLILLLGAIGCDRSEPVARHDDAGPNGRSDGVASAPATPAPSGTLPRIVFLGDSLTAGLGIGKDQAVPALIQQQLERDGYAYEAVNAGNSGDTSDGGLTRLDWSL